MVHKWHKHLFLPVQYFPLYHYYPECLHSINGFYTPTIISRYFYVPSQSFPLKIISEMVVFITKTDEEQFYSRVRVSGVYYHCARCFCINSTMECLFITIILFPIFQNHTQITFIQSNHKNRFECLARWILKTNYRICIN